MSGRPSLPFTSINNVSNPLPVQIIAGRDETSDEYTFLNKVIPAKTMYSLLDKEEVGQVKILAMYADNPGLGVNLELQCKSGTIYRPFTTHQTYNDLLRLSMGLSPGDVKLIAGLSPDRTGTPNHSHPFLTRWKSTTESDALGESIQIYGMAWLPVPHVDYTRRIKLEIFNNTETDANIYHFSFARKIFTQAKSL